MKFAINQQKYIALSQGNRKVEIGFVKSPFVCGKFTIFGYPIKRNLHPLINSPVSGHPPYFSLVSAHENTSRKRTALPTDTFFNSRGCPLTRELTVLEFRSTQKITKRFTLQYAIILFTSVHTDRRTKI